MQTGTASRLRPYSVESSSPILGTMDLFNKTLKVIIAGGRDFKDYELLEKVCDEHLQKYIDFGYNIKIISGLARGADSLGVNYAKSKEYKVHKFPANWDLYGKSAGFIRNEDMARFSDALIAFWDGKSKGTKNMINLAKEYKLNTIHIEHYDS